LLLIWQVVQLVLTKGVQVEPIPWVTAQLYIFKHTRDPLENEQLYQSLVNLLTFNTTIPQKMFLHLHITIAETFVEMSPAQIDRAMIHFNMVQCSDSCQIYAAFALIFLSFQADTAVYGVEGVQFMALAQINIGRAKMMLRLEVESAQADDYIQAALMVLKQMPANVWSSFRSL
jgi:hypothetical protein